MTGLCIAVTGRPAGGRDPQAFIARTGKGFALAGRDLGRLFQDSAGTVPVALADDPVGRVNLLPSGVMDQGAADRRPLWKGAGLAFDGGTDNLAAQGAVLSVWRAAPAYFAMVRFSTASLAVIQNLVAASSATATDIRFSVAVLTTGAVRVIWKRLDADSATTVTSAAGLVGAGTDYTLSVAVDLVGGAGALSVLLDGVSILSESVAGSGPSQDADSGRLRLGASLANTPSQTLAGVLTGAVCAPAVPTAAEHATLRAWLERAA